MTGRGGTDDTLGERLRAARKAKKLSLDALAERIGGKASRKTVIRWEADENIPGPAYRGALVRELNLPGDFFDGIDQPVEARLSRRVTALEQTVARIERRLFGEDAVQGR